MTARRDSSWDILVDNRNGQLVLAVEVKRKTGASSTWAASLRRNILAHGTFSQPPYFLMVFPDKFYLWSNNRFSDNQAYLENTEPDYTIDASSVLAPYFERSGFTPEQVSADSLELVIISWLGEIMTSRYLSETTCQSQQWLIESGLHAAIAGGKVRQEAVV